MKDKKIEVRMLKGLFLIVFDLGFFMGFSLGMIFMFFILMV
jgi:hypothetical protein